MRFLRHGGLGHQHLVKSAGGDHGVLILLVDGRHLLEAAQDRAHGAAEHEQIARAHFAVDHENSRHQKQRQMRGRGDRADDRLEIGEHADALEDPTLEGIAIGLIFVDLLAFGGERLDDVHAGDVLGDDRDVAVLGLHHAAGDGLDLAAEAQDVKRPDRQRNQRQGGDPFVDGPDQDDVEGHGHQDVQRHQHGGLDESADVLQIGEGAVNQLPRVCGHRGTRSRLRCTLS